MTNSPEKPIGKVCHRWWRCELQEVGASVPHTHSTLWLKEDDGMEKGLEHVLSHVRASISSIATPEEARDCIDQGIISPRQALLDMLDNFTRVLLHKHNQHCLVLRQEEGRTFGSFHSNSVKLVAVNGSATGRVCSRLLTKDALEHSCRICTVTKSK